MIQIKIDGKPAQIPTFNELTVKQYRELLPFIADSGAIDPLRYISVTTGINYTKSLHCVINNLDRLNNLMPDFLFIAGDIDAAGKKGFIETAGKPNVLGYNKFIYDLRRKSVNSAGYRIVLDSYMKTEHSYLDMYIFMAALVINTERDDLELAFDYDTVKELANDLESYNAVKVLTTGSFFFWKWKRKEFKESRLSRMLRRVLLTSMRLRSPKLVLIDSRSITQYQK